MSYKKFIKYILVSIVILVLTFSCYYYKNIRANNNKDSIEVLVSKPSEDNSSDIISEIDTEKIQAIEKEVLSILGENKDYYGVYYYDINSGGEYCLNEDKLFLAASTIKVPVSMMIADKIYNNEISENDEITYFESYYESGAGDLQDYVIEGDKIAVSELIEKMIVDSDNIACNMLRSIAGSRNEYYMDITGQGTDENENTVTVKQQFLMLKHLYENEDNNRYYNKIVNYMKNTTVHNRLDKYIPQEIVAHKIGDYLEAVNDIGIIYTDKPYILCVLSNGDSLDNEAENIAKISESIYSLQIN